jgi:hypothetical protein
MNTTIKRSGITAFMEAMVIPILSVLSILLFTVCRDTVSSSYSEYTPPETPGPVEDGLLVIGGAVPGNSYWADIYSYSEAIEEEASLPEIIAASAKIGAGWSRAEADSLALPLKSPDGTNGFADSGAFLVVLMEVDPEGNSSVRYQAAVLFAEGKSAVDWTTMPDAPSLAASSMGGVIVLSGSGVGVSYAADVYRYSGSGVIDDYATWTQIIGGAVKAGAGSATASDNTVSIMLNAPDGGRFYADGDFLVVITSVNFERQVVAKYMTGVRFTDGRAYFEWRELNAAPEQSLPDADTGILTLVNKTAGRTYGADVYSYSKTGTGGLLPYDDYKIYTDESQRVASGERQSSKIYLKETAGGAIFERSGTFLVVITEYSGSYEVTGTRYQTAAAFEKRGCAVLDWSSMAAVPNPDFQPDGPEKGILTLEGMEAGFTYEASVYGYTTGGQLSYADYIEHTAGSAANRMAVGATKDGDNFAKLTKLSDGSAFDGKGPFLVKVDELDGGSAVQRTFYRTAVLFDANGCATLVLTGDGTDAAWPAPLQPDILTVTDNNGGGSYSAFVYDSESPKGTLTYFQFAEQTAEAGKLAASSGFVSGSLVPLVRGTGEDGQQKITANGKHLVVVKRSGGTAATEDRYELEVEFDKDGRATVHFQDMHPVPVMSFAEVLMQMKMDAEAGKTETSYSIGSGTEDFKEALINAYGTSMETNGADITLTTANSPAKVTIIGGGRVIDGSSANALDADNQQKGGNASDAEASTRYFNIGSGVSITLQNITFKSVPFKVQSGGTLTLQSGAVIRDNKSHWWHNGTWGVFQEKYSMGFADGTGVRVEGGGKLEMTGGEITGNEHSGVQVTGNGTFNMAGGRVHANSITSRFSGGKWNGAGVSLCDTAVFNMTGGEVSGNTALGWSLIESYSSGGGVGIYNRAEFKLSGGKVSDNTAGAGGGLYMKGDSVSKTAKLYLSGSGEISGNRQVGGDGYDGGGVSAPYYALVTMSGGAIRGNETARSGGAIALSYNGVLNMTGGVIENNTATGLNGAGIYISQLDDSTKSTMNEGGPQVIAPSGQAIWGLQPEAIIQNNTPCNIIFVVKSSLTGPGNRVIQ